MIRQALRVPFWYSKNRLSEEVCNEIIQLGKDLDIKEAGFDKFLAKTVSDNKGKILALVKNRLFQRGEDGDGKKISPGYSRKTIAKKRNKRQRTSHVTLRDTGEFYKSMFVEFINNNIIIDSNDDVTPLLEEKYGEAILKLTDYELDFVIDSILEPAINKFINDFNTDINIEI